MSDELSIDKVIWRFGTPCDQIKKTVADVDWVRVLAVSGYSTPNLRGMLNNLCRFEGCNYLEVGTLHGGTLIAASYKNPGTFCGIDNFSQFSGSFDRVKKTLDDFAADCRCSFKLGDCRDISLDRLPIGINVLFYDGEHSEQCTHDTIVRFDDLLADKFLLIVDDYSWIGPRKGAESAITELGWNAHLKIAIEDNYNRNGWGVGLLIVLAEKRK